ncbi:hypothetical protein [uncultured Chryseobacterium sp.]|uniref:hypothetical protein n=1 Tax=uncultured Chryseobacterium sp. TaxID=259322 RepID=UPI0025DE39B5|nr:hypothetical protein [uncultured Chryseobacterium sp.]
MAKYMICIELENATVEQYDLLYASMSRINALRIIYDPFVRQWYKLPRSQYHYEGVISNKETMTELINNIVKQIVMNYKIVITGDDGSAWIGLDKTNH